MDRFISNAQTRRRLSLSLIGLGGVLIFLAPEGMLLGWIPMIIGIGLEILGIKLGYREKQ